MDKFNEKASIVVKKIHCMDCLIEVHYFDSKLSVYYNFIFKQSVHNHNLDSNEVMVTYDLFMCFVQIQFNCIFNTLIYDKVRQPFLLLILVIYES